MMTDVAGGRTARKAVVLGLDGVPYTLLRRFCDEGVMPRVSELLREGTVAPMDTALPEISSTAWTSFMTGVNPGKHAVYGFMDLDPKSYKLQFTNFNSVRTPTLWDYLSREGKRSMVLNIPTTYPARDLIGVLISGFVAIDLKRATFPASLVPYLEQVGYKLDVDTTTFKQSTDAFVDELWDALAKREQVLWHLLTTEAWDLYIGVITETDRLHHYLWAAIEDEGHKYHSFFKDYYRKVDAFIGRVREKVGPDPLFMIMSDHGFCEIQKEIYLNHWLQEQGYLQFGENPPKSHQDIADTTRAFNMDPARIYVHRKGVYAKGSVDAQDAPALVDEIARKLATLTVDGKPVIQRIFRKEELYKGYFLPQAPDLVLLPHRGFDLKGTITQQTVAGRSVLTGMHTQDDAVLFVNRPITKGTKAHIMDLAPTVLSHLGVALPPELDGVSLVGS
jgi:predicted AlkP superfamily phosphohydrolase/phosphomutase